MRRAPRREMELAEENVEERRKWRRTMDVEGERRK
jgi:hypothetical protein